MELNDLDMVVVLPPISGGMNCSRDRRRTQSMLSRLNSLFCILLNIPRGRRNIKVLHTAHEYAETTAELVMKEFMCESCSKEVSFLSTDDDFTHRKIEVETVGEFNILFLITPPEVSGTRLIKKISGHEGGIEERDLRTGTALIWYPQSEELEHFLGNLIPLS